MQSIYAIDVERFSRDLRQEREMSRVMTRDRRSFGSHATRKIYPELSTSFLAEPPWHVNLGGPLLDATAAKMYHGIYLG